MCIRDRFKCLGDAIEKAKTDYQDPLIIIGGDTNKRDITPAIADFPDMYVAPVGPTRGRASLDIVATNAPGATFSTFFPLETEDSDRTSDHLTVIGDIKSARVHLFETLKHSRRKYSKKAEENFGKDLLLVDWDCLQGNSPSETTVNVSAIL